MLQNRLFKGNTRVALLWSISTSLVFSLFAFYPSITNKLEYPYQDLLQKSCASFHNPSKQIVQIYVDDSSLDQASQLGAVWPWPRDFFAQMITQAKNAEALGIAFDLLFLQPDFDGVNRSGVYADSMFANAMKSDFPIILSGVLQTDSIDGTKLIKPMQQFDAPFGLTNVLPEYDGITRKYTSHYQYHSTQYLSLALASAKIVRDLPSIPERFRLRFYGSSGASSPFTTLRAIDLVNGTIPHEVLRNKLIVVGVLATGVMDVIPTPLATVTDPFTGLELNVTAMSNILEGDWLSDTQDWISFLYTFFLSGTFLILVVGKRLSRVFLIALVVFMFLLISSTVAYYYNILLPFVIPLVTITVSSIVALICGWSSILKDQLRLQKLFSLHLTDEVAKHLSDHPEKIKLGGEKISVTVVFVDIVGFSAFSEKHDPETVVKELNRVFTPITEVMLSKGAFVDKFIGDAMLIVFGLPISSDNDLKNACNATLVAAEMISKLDTPFEVNFGINRGEVIAGYIGHDKRMDYTIIGDAVNLAQRLEHANRELGTTILISDEVCNSIRSDFVVRRIGKIQVKNRSSHENVWELLPFETNTKLLSEWNRAWVSIDCGNKLEGITVLQDLTHLHTKDRALKLFIERFSNQLNTRGSNHVESNQTSQENSGNV